MTVIAFDTSNSKINILNLGHCVLTINMLLIISTEDPKYNNSVCYAPNFEEVEGHIGLGLSVRPSVRPSVRLSVRPSVCQ